MNVAKQDMKLVCVTEEDRVRCMQMIGCGKNRREQLNKQTNKQKQIKKKKKKYWNFYEL